MVAWFWQQSCSIAQKGGGLLVGLVGALHWKHGKCREGPPAVLWLAADIIGNSPFRKNGNGAASLSEVFARARWVYWWVYHNRYFLKACFSVLYNFIVSNLCCIQFLNIDISHFSGFLYQRVLDETSIITSSIFWCNICPKSGLVVVSLSRASKLLQVI